MMKEERLQKQLARLAEMKEPEQDLHRQGYRYIAGVDEVGRGPLAGPVVTAAVILPEDFDIPGIDDSKKLSEKRREELFDVITEKALAWGIGQADHEVIDEINILQATKRAMMEAIREADAMLRQRLEKGEIPAGREEDAMLRQERGEKFGEREEDAPGSIDYVLLDAVELPGLQVPQQAVIKGDAKVLAIAAASIVAKVWRDRMMVEYAKEFPFYAFEKNKGYGTKEHYASIREHGICPIHRKTFLKTIH